LGNAANDALRVNGLFEAVSLTCMDLRAALWSLFHF
jgi:hypothetical protein